MGWQKQADPQSRENQSHANRLKTKLHRFLNLKLHVTLKGKSVECVGESRCLGVTIDSSLDFKIHTEKVSLKVKQKLGVIRRLKTYFSTKQLSDIYWGYIIPHVLYCCNVWSRRSVGNFNTLNKLHKRAAYIVSNKSWDIPSLDVLQSLCWPTLDKLFWKTMCCLMYKCVNRITPGIVHDRFIHCKKIIVEITQ